MIGISPVNLANAKSNAALGGASGSKQPAQTRTNNPHTKLNQAMPVRGSPQKSPYTPLVAAPCTENGAQSLT